MWEFVRMINDFENRINVYIRVSVGSEERFGECTEESRDSYENHQEERKFWESSLHCGCLCIYGKYWDAKMHIKNTC